MSEVKTFVLKREKNKCPFNAIDFDFYAEVSYENPGIVKPGHRLLDGRSEFTRFTEDGYNDDSAVIARDIQELKLGRLNRDRTKFKLNPDIISGLKEGESLIAKTQVIDEYTKLGIYIRTPKFTKLFAVPLDEFCSISISIDCVDATVPLKEIG